MRRLWLISFLAAAAGLALGAVWWGLKAHTKRQYRAAILEGKAAADAGATAKAWVEFTNAAALRPELGEAQYLLGAVEKAMGRPDAARAAWQAVPPGSEFARHAAMMLARAALVADRQADAEPYLKAALSAVWPTRPTVCRRVRPPALSERPTRQTPRVPSVNPHIDVSALDGRNCRS